jgi:hypothetical protein
MRLPRLIAVTRLLWLFITTMFLAAVPSALRAQDVPAAPSPQSTSQAAPQPFHLKDYSIPRAAFPHVLQPYRPEAVAQPILSNSSRIDTLMRDGKIYLSINDAVALALENNLDIDIARYNLNIADADLLRAKSGASILGVNTGIVQNTPGGGVGGLGGTVGSGTGGTTVAAGGAGTGTNGLVSSTLGIGAPITGLRSPDHQHATVRPRRHRVGQPGQSRSSHRAKHLHRKLRLHPRLRVGRRAHRILQQHPLRHQQSRSAC